MLSASIQLGSSVNVRATFLVFWHYVQMKSNSAPRMLRP